MTRRCGSWPLWLACDELTLPGWSVIRMSTYLNLQGSQCFYFQISGTIVCRLIVRVKDLEKYVNI
jgi:hypothetical protein